MKAMILAAGRGNRMRPLTDHTPKTLLMVGNDPLIVHHIKNFAKANIREIVINLGHLGEKLKTVLGDGSQFEVNLQYSEENPVLETAGGIKKALNLLGNEPFIVVSGDIFTDFPFERLKEHQPNDPKSLAHLVLVDNPPHHPRGDYALVEGYLSHSGQPLLNFGGIGVYRSEFFSDCPEGPFPLAKLFAPLVEKRSITGEYYKGSWYNIGTPEQLAEANQIQRLQNP